MSPSVPLSRRSPPESDTLRQRRRVRICLTATDEPGPIALDAQLDACLLTVFNASLSKQ